MPRALVVTIVHNPEDSRIRHRQISALLERGWQVTYAAPFSGYDLPVPDHGRGPDTTTTQPENLRLIDLPRAVGRHRLRAIAAARRLLRSIGRRHDVVLLHDPELLLAVPGTGVRAVWDVHEDTAAAILTKTWIPGPLRSFAAASVRAVERRAESSIPLLLADYGYSERFRREHPVVPNTVRVPERISPPEAGRVIYLGSLSVDRGVHELAEVGRLLRAANGPRLEVVGPAHGEAADVMAGARDAGNLSWHGFLPSDEALTRLDGALAGLSLLRDLPNFRPSMPTKVLEYMAYGVPVITTPVPLAERLVSASGAGIVVPFEDARAAVDAVLELAADPARAARLGAAGRESVRERYDWNVLAAGFVAALDSVVKRAPLG